VTLLVALKGSDGLVLAADSRGTFGDPRATTAQNDSQQKAHVLRPHVGLLMAGAGELGTSLLRQGVSSLPADGATLVMQGFRAHARATYADWLPHLPPAAVPGMPMLARPDLVFIVAGYDQDPDGAFTIDKIYQLQSGWDFAPNLHEYGFALAGVPQYALYLLNRLYEPNRTLQELIPLAVYAITETASQDGKVGGPVRVITITPADGCKELDTAGVDSIQAANAKRSTALKRSFYSRRTKTDG
jgi:20S proteasome alpha/beta subunit